MRFRLAYALPFTWLDSSRRRASGGLAASVVGAVLLTACGGEAAPSASAPTVRPAVTTAPVVPTTAPAAAAPTVAPTVAPTAAPATAAPAARVVMVNVVDNRFEPVTLEVPEGTTVRWTNNGRDDHDVVSLDFRTFESPLLKAGQTFEFTAAQPGQVPYVCTLHDGMTATLVVR